MIPRKYSKNQCLLFARFLNKFIFPFYETQINRLKNHKPHKTKQLQEMKLLLKNQCYKTYLSKLKIPLQFQNIKLQILEIYNQYRHQKSYEFNHLFCFNIFGNKKTSNYLVKYSFLILFQVSRIKYKMEECRNQMHQILCKNWQLVNPIGMDFHQRTDKTKENTKLLQQLLLKKLDFSFLISYLNNISNYKKEIPKNKNFHPLEIMLKMHEISRLCYRLLVIKKSNRRLIHLLLLKELKFLILFSNISKLKLYYINIVGG